MILEEARAKTKRKKGDGKKLDVVLEILPAS
jgi:hypothetical protein